MKEFETDADVPEYAAVLLSDAIVISRRPIDIVKELVDAVAPFESVTLRVMAESPVAVGVPEIVPVEVLRDKPDCKVPEAIA